MNRTDEKSASSFNLVLGSVEWKEGVEFTFLTDSKQSANTADLDI